MISLLTKRVRNGHKNASLKTASYYIGAEFVKGRQKIEWFGKVLFFVVVIQGKQPLTRIKWFERHPNYSRNITKLVKRRSYENEDPWITVDCITRKVVLCEDVEDPHYSIICDVQQYRAQEY